MGRLSSDERKELCSKLHNGKYDYSKSDFSNVKRKTIIICPIHGEFEMDYDHHHNQASGCRKCIRPSYDTESFINEALRAHNGFYSYNLANYVNAHEKVIITCPRHGNFGQSPNAHICGQGCPKCASEKKSRLEDKVERLLNENGIEYAEQYRIGKLILDFYISSIKLGIECQGKQHFGKGGWSKKFDFNTQFERDRRKYDLCNENGIEVIYFANKYNKPSEYFGKIFTDEGELLDYTRYLLENKEHK